MLCYVFDIGEIPKSYHPDDVNPGPILYVMGKSPRQFSGTSSPVIFLKLINYYILMLGMGYQIHKSIYIL